ncbi:MAG: hypothetical protein WBF06_02575 [Candidatus Acidiferrales bacterium]
MPMDFDLIPPDTCLEANGKGAPVDIRPSQTRIFFLVMEITDQIEQESADVSIEGSADGETWTPQPILKLPQRFYRGQTRAVLDLTTWPEVNFIRAAWDLNRWGRVDPHPMFALGLRANEMPAMSGHPKRAAVVAR